jgi:sulfopyruvate decarboxylase subunit alpha
VGIQAGALERDRRRHPADPSPDHEDPHAAAGYRGASETEVSLHNRRVATTPPAPPRRSARAQAVADGLADWRLEQFVHVPSSHIAPVITGLQEHGVTDVLANREEEAVGIAGGMALAGVRVALLMQDNGFGNALTALTTFALAYHVGLPIVANVRGGLGEYNAMIHAISGAAPALLADAGLPVHRLGPAEGPGLWRSTTTAVAEHAVMTNRPVVLLVDLMHPATAGPA